MKYYQNMALLGLLLLGLCAGSVDAAEKPLRKAMDNRIRAQALVNQMMKDHPELLIGGIHATAPGDPGPTIIASTLDRIGAADDEGDISVGVGGRTILVPGLKNPQRFGLLIPLKDSSGKRIGALALAFKPTVDDDETRIFLLGTAIRNELALKIPALESLFFPSHEP